MCYEINLYDKTNDTFLSVLYKQQRQKSEQQIEDFNALQTFHWNGQ